MMYKVGGRHIFINANFKYEIVGALVGVNFLQ